jgi:glycosyltransferase involved in cell wall biosynthesis
MGAAIAAHCPLVVHLHGTRVDSSLGWFLKRADVIMVPCEAMRSWVRSIARMSDVVVAPPPVAIEVPAVGSKPNLVLFLGRLDAEKGIYDLLEAVAAVRANVPDLRLVCAGEGDRIGVARYAERLGIADAVKFTGWVGPSGKRALFENASVIALPRYSAGLPTSLLEAMAAGVPAIASPVGAIPEVLNDGASGVLVAPGDIAALTRALRKLLLDRAFAERVGAAGRETVRARFAPDRVMPRLEEIYADAGLAAQAPQPSGRGVDLRKAA